jgi:hypothetical protein
MPTNLPPEPPPQPWLGPVLRVVVLVATVRDESIAQTLLWRYRISEATSTVGVWLGYAAAILSHRHYWRISIGLFRLALLLMSVAAWVRPDSEGKIMRRIRGTS